MTESAVSLARSPARPVVPGTGPASPGGQRARAPAAPSAVPPTVPFRPPPARRRPDLGAGDEAGRRGERPLLRGRGSVTSGAAAEQRGRRVPMRAQWRRPGLDDAGGARRYWKAFRAYVLWGARPVPARYAHPRRDARREVTGAASMGGGDAPADVGSAPAPVLARSRGGTAHAAGPAHGGTPHVRTLHGGIAQGDDPPPRGPAHGCTPHEPGSPGVGSPHGPRGAPPGPHPGRPRPPARGKALSRYPGLRTAPPPRPLTEDRRSGRSGTAHGDGRPGERGSPGAGRPRRAPVRHPTRRGAGTPGPRRQRPADVPLLNHGSTARGLHHAARALPGDPTPRTAPQQTGPRASRHP